MGISSIDVDKVVKDYRHSPVAPMNVAQWFVDETITLNFGDYVNKPDENIQLHSEYLTKFLENGWTIDAVVSSGSSGVWQRFENKDTENISRPYTEETYSESESHDTYSTVDTYWSSWTRIRLKRRRMQPERVLQSMITDLTSQYNYGKNIEDSRYNEVITLYAMTLSHTEAECNEILTHGSDLSGLYQKYLKSVDIAVTGANNAAAQVSQTAQQAALDEMRRNFDALIAQAEAKMISNGTYNSTVWPSVLAGIERQRDEALNKAKADSASVAVTAWTSVANVKGGVYAQMLAAGQAMIDALDKRMMSVTDARNSVVKWIVDFIGERKDVYPQLSEISQVTERLGFSVGSANNAL